MSALSILGPLVEKIANLLVEEAKLLYGAKGQAKRLKRELIWINKFLIEVDRRQLEEGDETLCAAIRDIREIAYDAEDVVDLLALEVKAKANANVRASSRFQRYFCSCASAVQTHSLGSDIEDINARIKEITELLQRYRNNMNLGAEAQRITKLRRPRSYPFGCDEYIVGLEEDINKLVTELTDSENELKLLSIAGMGGSGKTTLARKLYSSDVVKQHFQFFAWVSLSQEWVTEEVLIEILSKCEHERHSSYVGMFLGELVDKLHGFLEHKLYMIVLDDVWRKDALEEILPAFPLGNKGGKIIVTTRNQEVVHFPNLSPWIHEPPQLSEEHSWELFSKIALNERKNHASFVDYEEVGKEMLKKCDGLPLAIIALGGLLSTKGTIEEWKKLRNAVSSKVMEVGRGTHLYGTVKNMLTLSYNDLPYELKPCFLYLGIFPENYELKVGMLINMWVAEGFITLQHEHGDETLEDVAREYLDELVQRCMVQVRRKNYKGKTKSIQIHSLMRDLCIRKAIEQDFVEVLHNRNSRAVKIAEQARRTSIHYYRSSTLPSPEESSRLRSLFLFGTAKGETYIDTLKHGDCSFRFLRVLNVEHIEFDHTFGLPFEIGNLIHLRYLGIKATNVTSLPSSIGNLQNLLTLHYTSLSEHCSLPDVLWKMEQLRHLYLPFIDITRRESFDPSMRPFSKLQTLWGVKAGIWLKKPEAVWIRNVQKLVIRVFSKELLDAVLCLSKESYNLRTLSLDWSYAKEGLHTRVKMHPEPLYQFQALEKLTLIGLFSDTESLAVRFPPTLKKLELVGSQFEEEGTLKVLGDLPNLKFLNLSDSSYMGKYWTCEAGEFPQLEELYICYLPGLQIWEVELGALCNLKKLNIWVCQALERLPIGLKSITTLQHLKLVNMDPAFLSRLEINVEDRQSTDPDGEDYHIVEHIPNVEIS